MNTELFEVIGDSWVLLERYKNKRNKSKSQINLMGFIAIGHKPNTEIFDFIDMENGYIKTIGGFNQNSTATNIPGIYR